MIKPLAITRGVIEPEQCFPYPEVLNEDQMETLQMLVSVIDRVSDRAKIFMRIRNRGVSGPRGVKGKKDFFCFFSRFRF